MFHYITFQIFISSWSFLGFLFNIFFLSLQCSRKLREVAKLKHYAAFLQWEGLQELELAIVDTPASGLVDLMSVGVH